MTTLIQSILWLLGVSLLFNGIYLLILKKLHIGTILPLLLGGLICFYLIFQTKIKLLLKQNSQLNKLWKLSLIIGISWILSVIFFFYYLKLNITTTTIQTPVSAIIVLGSGTKQGKPLAPLQARLDTAAKLVRQQPNSLIVLSGGIDYGETLSEAEVMANYLNTEYQIPKQKMILEKESTSTELNLVNSKKLLRQQNISLSQPIAIVTSDFHTVRAAKIANKVGYKNIHMVSANTPLNIRYNIWLREYFAFISGWVLDEY